MTKRISRALVETTNELCRTKKSFSSRRRIYHKLGWISALLVLALFLLTGCGEDIKPIIGDATPTPTPLPTPTPTPTPNPSRDVVFDFSRALDGSDGLLANSDAGNV